MYARHVKRICDVAFAIVAMIVLAPIMAITAVAILLDDGSPVIFKQRRVGLDGREFTVFKFRSMAIDTGDVAKARAQGARVTTTGRIIRRLSVDELPQLWNITRGDMSIVGPRPPLVSQTVLLELRRHNGAFSCRPGLTGLAQVNAYDGMTEETKAMYDGQYVAHISAGRDLGIIMRTIGYLFRTPPVY